MTTTTHIDYDAARERLSSITTDPAALAGLDRIRATGELDGAFMAVVDELRSNRPVCPTLMAL